MGFVGGVNVHVEGDAGDFGSAGQQGVGRSRARDVGIGLNRAVLVLRLDHQRAVHHRQVGDQLARSPANARLRVECVFHVAVNDARGAALGVAGRGGADLDAAVGAELGGGEDPLVVDRA